MEAVTAREVVGGVVVEEVGVVAVRLWVADWMVAVAPASEAAGRVWVEEAKAVVVVETGQEESSRGML